MRKFLLSSVTFLVVLSLAGCSGGDYRFTQLDDDGTVEESSETSKNNILNDIFGGVFGDDTQDSMPETTPAVTTPAIEYPEIPDETPSSEYTYEFDMETNGVKVTGYNGTAMKVKIPATFEGEPVTAVDCDFADTIIQIEFPPTVQIITEETLPDSIKYFNVPRDITKPIIRYKYGYDDLYDTRSLDYLIAVKFDDGITELTEVNVPKVVKSNVEDTCTYILPDSITSIGYNAFAYCNTLTSITIPNSVTSIGEYAFGNCDALTNITIPNSVTSIGESAFRGCDALTNITIPNSVTSIGDEAFEGCDTLTSITIPNSVTSIGISVFYECRSLASITIPNSVTSIGDTTFSGCAALTSITIPNSVTSIGNYAFSNCDALTNMTIPNSVTSIVESAFWGCSDDLIITYKGKQYTQEEFFKDNRSIIAD